MYLLKIKHWQLFGLLILVPVFFQLIGIESLLNGDPRETFKMFPILVILFCTIMYSWIYSIGIFMNKRLPQTVSLNLTTFRVFTFFIVTYVIMAVILMTLIFSDTIIAIPNMTMVFLMLHLFVMFCIFYCMWFTAKSLKSVELQRPVTFSDFAGDFLLILFFPIGVWIIQPRINKLFEQLG